MVVWLHKQIEETRAAVYLFLVILYSSGSAPQGKRIFPTER